MESGSSLSPARDEEGAHAAAAESCPTRQREEMPKEKRPPWGQTKGFLSPVQSQETSFQRNKRKQKPLLFLLSSDGGVFSFSLKASLSSQALQL